KGTAHPTADTYIKSLQLASFSYSNEAQIIGIDVNIIVGRNGEGYLKFTWQIAFKVQGFFMRRSSNFLFIKPNLIVSPGFGQKIIAQLTGTLVYLFMNEGLIGIWIAHHISINVPTG